MFFEEYDNLLSELTAQYGLRHGYLALNEGLLAKHFIYKDMGVKIFLWGLIKKPRRRYVAEIVVERDVQVNGYIGYLTFGHFSVRLLDESLREVVEEISQQVICANPQGVFSVKRKLNIIEWR